MKIERDELLEAEKYYFGNDTLEEYDKILGELKKHYSSNFDKGYKRGYESCKRDINELLQKKVDELCDTMYEEAECQDIK